MLQLHAWFHYPSELLVSARAPLLDSNICKQHKRSVVKNMRLQTSNSVCGMKMVVPWDFHTIRFQTSQIGGFHGIKVAGQDPIMMVFSFGRRIWREITCGIMSGMIYNLCLVLYQPIFFLWLAFHFGRVSWLEKVILDLHMRLISCWTQRLSIPQNANSFIFMWPQIRTLFARFQVWEKCKSWVKNHQIMMLIGLFRSIPRSARFLRGLEYKL